MQQRSDRPTGCPGAGTLAAYLDGRLGEAERCGIEKHISVCDVCLDVVAEVMVLEGGVAGPEPALRARARTPRPWVRSMAAAVLAALLLPALLYMARFTQGASLRGAPSESDGRLVEARLTSPMGEPRWTWVTARRDRDAAGVQADQRAPRAAAGAGRTAFALHSEGVARAVAGDWAGAVFGFVAATRAQPDDARLQSDTAAAYLERASTPGRAADVVHALAAAQRAISLDPALAEAWFNRALALERLWLRSLASAAWVDYLRVDSLSPWADEARRHAGSLATPRLSDRWLDIEAALRQRVDPALVEEAVRLHVSAARRLLEAELFPRWATATASGTDAVSEREDLRTMAGAFQRLTRDTLYLDAVGAIERAERLGPSAARSLAAAHLDYARAAAVLAQERLTAAQPGLESAARALKDAKSPYAMRARLDLSVVAYYTGQIAAVASTLAPLHDEAERLSYTFLESRALWLRGLASFGNGRYTEAQGLWERMLAATERMGDEEGRAAAHGLLANLLELLADNDGAWRHRLAYLRVLNEYRADRTRLGLLMSAADHALNEDAAAALALQEAVIEEARLSERAPALPEAYAQRAAIHAALGRAPQARVDLDAAWDGLRGVDDLALSARLKRALLTAEVRTLGSLRGAGLIQATERAVAAAKAGGGSARLPELYLLLGRAHLRDGRISEAAVSAEAGLSILRSSARTARIVPEEIQGLSQVAMRAALAVGDVATAYRHGAFARSRPQAFEDTKAALDHRSVQRRLEDHEAVLALNQLDDEIVSWLVTKSSVQFHIGHLTRGQSERLVDLQQSEIARAAHRPQASAALFRELVRPFGPTLSRIERVTVAPDSPFFAASFPALFDRAAGRFWVENVDLTVEGSSVGGPRDEGRAALVDIPPDAPPVEAFDRWRGARRQAIVRISARTISNHEFPELSRLLFADRPGFPHSGVVLVRDLPALPPVKAVLLPHLDPGPLVMSGAGRGLAREFLGRGAAHVITLLAPGALTADQSNALLVSLTSGVSVPAAVAQFQREALRADHRLGPWSRLVVYGNAY